MKKQLRFARKNKNHQKTPVLFFKKKASLPSKTYLKRMIKDTYKYDFNNTPKSADSWV